MKKALKAISIGDKLYNLERIHSKLLHFLEQHRKEAFAEFEVRLSNALHELSNTVSCFSNATRSREVVEYVEAIGQVHYALTEASEDLFVSLCYLASRFARFKENYGREFSHLNKGCEQPYQHVCVNLYFIESLYKARKRAG